MVLVIITFSSFKSEFTLIDSAGFNLGREWTVKSRSEEFTAAFSSSFMSFIYELSRFNTKI